MEDMVVAAKVGAPRGLKGEVSLFLSTDREEECFAVGQQVRSTHPDFPVLTVERLTYGRGRAFAYFEEVRNRDDSEALTGSQILVPALSEEDAWYPSELEGIPVFSVSGETLGTVKKLELGAAQDRLVVSTESGEVMVPFVEALVPIVDVKERRVVVDPPEGLFE